MEILTLLFPSGLFTGTHCHGRIALVISMAWSTDRASASQAAFMNSKSFVFNLDLSVFVFKPTGSPVKRT